ncbi:eukaryotic translation initiation factor 3 subunit K-like isoform X1 [Daphnia magna]|uniref:eukaryotic translation initiation factor 3 subunit K-like isoform X1 n=1 Tax=Daphnia magna TaxID=35525 RepID=UPI001E1BA97D|nr:eukaryotic translation initiation factor 3 subunit K-like isoform X1 [Daphnia magna]
MAEKMRTEIASMLQGIERYNPDNLQKLERYVEMQAQENIYDLEANLSVLRLYQFGPNFYRSNIVNLILLKAMTNLPHTDFLLCKCLLTQDRLEEPQVSRVMVLADLLETCKFKQFWEELAKCGDLIITVQGFEDAIRKFVVHVVNITYQTIEVPVLKELLGNVNGMGINSLATFILISYVQENFIKNFYMTIDQVLKQWVGKCSWKDLGNGRVFITSQEDLVKTKNITEKIEFENVAGIMAHCI